MTLRTNSDTGRIVFNNLNKQNYTNAWKITKKTKLSLTNINETEISPVWDK